MVNQQSTDLTERVFAYGSNMCSRRFRDYDVHPLKAGIAVVLRHHSLSFNKRSTEDCSGKANVEPNEATDVWGVLYEIPEGELRMLNKKEGGYIPRCMSVETTSGVIWDAWVLFARKPEANPLRPYTWYLRFLVEGAIEHHLPNDYNRKPSRDSSH